MTNTIKAILFGFAGWVAAYILVILLRDLVFNEPGIWLVLAYLLCFPAGVAFTLVAQMVMNLPMRDMEDPMIIIAIVPLILDGISFGFTKVYGAGAHELYTAAFLLWAPGAFLIAALWLIRRAKHKVV